MTNDYVFSSVVLATPTPEPLHAFDHSLELRSVDISIVVGIDPLETLSHLFGNLVSANATVTVFIALQEPLHAHSTRHPFELILVDKSVSVRIEPPEEPPHPLGYLIPADAAVPVHVAVTKSPGHAAPAALRKRSRASSPVRVSFQRNPVLLGDGNAEGLGIIASEVMNRRLKRGLRLPIVDVDKELTRITIRFDFDLGTDAGER